MNDVKSVKVDNWGVFFLQKLQNFFNKTDYCDLTLQFQDNSQLKVHRLVLNACTEFFNVLENTTNCRNDILIMPPDLQADVVVPIVNFMYTGTLEFEVRMYERLLRTARDMNMTVLTKLLEAHKKAVPSSNPPIVLNKFQNPPKVFGSGASTRGARGLTSSTPAGRQIIYGRAVGGGSKYVPEQVKIMSKYSPSSDLKRGPSRFEATVSSIENFDSSFTDISYESKPLTTEKDEAQSSFERLRRLGNVNPNKRPAPSVVTSPPSKKLNLQDVKEYAEATRMRKQLASQDPDYEVDEDFAAMDDDYSNSSDDQAPSTQNTPKSNQKTSPGASTQKITVRSGTNTVQVMQDVSKMDHAKIISEVLKKYPHLVKNSKNIKLKIMPKASSTTVTKPAPAPVPVARPAPAPVVQVKNPVGRPRLVKAEPVAPVKVVPAPVQAKPAPAPAPAADSKPVPKGNRIDSKTMHALIAKGAENMDGPWLCLRCGVDGKPIGLPSYKAFRKHLVNVHSEKIDPRLCVHCGWRSEMRLELHYHMMEKHEIEPPEGVVFPKCEACQYVAINRASLLEHQEEEGHVPSMVCPICDKSFMNKRALTMHTSVKHKGEKLSPPAKYVPNLNAVQAAKNKVKILSDITLTGKFIKTEEEAAVKSVAANPSSEAEALSNVASGIATSLGVEFHDESGDHSEEMIEEAMASNEGEEFDQDESNPQDSQDESVVVTKFVGEDGAELDLTPAQKKELMSQLQAQEDGNVVMVLNPEHFPSDETVETEETKEKEDNKKKSVKEELETSHEESTSAIDLPSTSMDYDSQTSELMDKSEQDSEAKLGEEEEEKHGESDADKMKLIRELEGEWTEPEEVEVKTEDESKSTKGGGGESLTSLLEEWTAEEDETDENKSQEKEEKPEVVKKAPPEENGSKEEVKDQPKPEAKEPENKEVEIEQQEEEPEEEDDEKEEGEEKKKSEKKASEITSLISDWAEDDDL